MWICPKPTSSGSRKKDGPRGRVGELLQNLLVIKVNGLEAMIRKLQN
jgi:uncharacterized protein (DUF3820 family)